MILVCCHESSRKGAPSHPCHVVMTRGHEPHQASSAGIQQAAELAQQGLIADKAALLKQQQADAYREEDELLAAQLVRDQPSERGETVLQSMPQSAGGAQVGPKAGLMKATPANN